MATEPQNNEVLKGVTDACKLLVFNLETVMPKCWELFPDHFRGTELQHYQRNIEFAKQMIAKSDAIQGGS